MPFKTLKKSHLKRNILIGVLVVGIIAAMILNFTRAKYRVTESVPLVNGTINYSLPDLNIIGLYIDGVEAKELDSSKTYTLDTEQSTCTYKDGSAISNLTLSYDGDTKTFTIAPYTTKGTKCTLYFEETDAVIPVISNVTLSSTQTSITVKVSASDNIGIDKYMFSINNGTYIESTSDQHIFNGLSPGVTYTIKVYVTDAANNSSVINTKTIATKSNKAYSVIENLYNTNKVTLAYDGTSDNNLRFIGTNPNNYVYFNCNDYNNPSSSTCELWRIIGIFNQTSHGISGQKLVKLIRNSTIGEIGWDSAFTNNWSTASLKTELNSDYLNGYSSNSIKNDITRNMIETVTWKLGGSSDSSTTNTIYSNERGTQVSTGNSTTWTGKVALMYASDYGFATSGGTTTSRATCLSTSLGYWNSSDCYNNNWLYSSNSNWTLTHSTQYDTGAVIMVSTKATAISTRTLQQSIPENYYRPTLADVKPTVYLKSNVIITGGTGTSSDPYRLNI